MKTVYGFTEMSETKRYEQPKIDVINYLNEDVLRASGGGNVYPPDSDWTGFY